MIFAHKPLLCKARKVNNYLTERDKNDWFTWNSFEIYLFAKTKTAG